MNECNTDYAQGGIASVMYDPDTFEKHIRDTLVCGAGICDRAAVEQVVTRAPEVIKQLIAWGVKFDKEGTGRYELAREGGHSEHRILHHKDITGHEIERALMRKVKRHHNIEILEHHFAVDILTQHHLGKLVRKSTPDITCFGAYVLNLKKHEIYTVLSKITVLATGGVGNIYHTTTNPSVATGDGIAMVHRAKGIVENMEFIQFHPTSLYNPGERPSFLISEAMRGFGGILRLQNGKEFMHKYHPMGSLAPRDVVARGIDHELKISGEEFVYLDITHKDPREVTDHFPNIYKKCLSVGIDLTKDMIPVVPAAHYCCGGVKVDLNGQSSIRRLYALGETSSTGLHGGNRLASNSLMEAAVYADAAVRHSIGRIDGIELQRDIPAWDYEGTTMPEGDGAHYAELQGDAADYEQLCGYCPLEPAARTCQTPAGDYLQGDRRTLFEADADTQDLCELRNMIAVGYLIIKHAEALHQSIGLHYSTDYPPARSNDNNG